VPHRSAPSRFRSEWIAPPELPDEEMIERFRQAFSSRPRIVEAWLLGNRILPEDGAPPYDASFIGLILDPPLTGESCEDRLDDFLAITNALDAETGFGREPDRGWEVVSEAEMSAHLEDAVRVYSRPASPE
jgi:hypothetical protein